MKFSHGNKTYVLGFRYGNPDLEKLIKANSRAFEVVGKPIHELNKGQIAAVLGLGQLPNPKIINCWLKDETKETIAEGKSTLHVEDVYEFDIEYGRKQAIGRVAANFPGSENKDLRRQIWKAYLNRKTKAE